MCHILFLNLPTALTRKFQPCRTTITKDLGPRHTTSSSSTPCLRRIQPRTAPELLPLPSSKGEHHYYQQQPPYPHALFTALPYSPQSAKPYSPTYHYHHPMLRLLPFPGSSLYPSYSNNFPTLHFMNCWYKPQQPLALVTLILQYWCILKQ